MFGQRRGHLDNQTAPDVNRRQPGGPVHGASQVHAVPSGGSHVIGVPLEHRNTVGLPLEAQNWEGSSTLYNLQELPIGGGGLEGDSLNGLSGSSTVVSANELARREGRVYPNRVPKQKAQPPVLPGPGPGPGAYQLQDGRILLINHVGQQTVVTQEQYHIMMERAKAPRPTIIDAVMSKIRGER